MDCIKNNKRGVEILTDYCAGILDPQIAFEIDIHIAQCAECRRMVEAQRTVWEMLDAWTPLEVSPNFDARLYARIAEERAEPAWRRLLDRVLRPATPYSLWKPAVSLAAAGAMVALALVVGIPENMPFTHTAPPATKSAAVHLNPTGQAGAGAEEIDLQQVQQALDDLEMLTPVGQSSPL
jgi:anti-sigma factor RsiW